MLVRRGRDSDWAAEDGGRGEQLTEKKELLTTVVTWCGRKKNNSE